MIRTLVSVVALAAIAVPHAASACLYTQRPEPVGHASGQYFAKVMVDAATYVDLVLVEDDGTRAMGEQPTGDSSTMLLLLLRRQRWCLGFLEGRPE